MLSPSSLLARSIVNAGRRAVHKGTESPPSRYYISFPQLMAMSTFMFFAAMSGPMYILHNLDSYRPLADNSINDEFEGRYPLVYRSGKH